MVPKEVMKVYYQAGSQLINKNIDRYKMSSFFMATYEKMNSFSFLDDGHFLVLHVHQFKKVDPFLNDKTELRCYQNSIFPFRAW